MHDPYPPTDDNPASSSSAPATLHVPVLCQSVTAFLKPSDEKLFVDATLGLGGHASYLLQAGARVIGLDGDSRNLDLAKVALRSFGDLATFVHENFRNITKALEELRVSEVDGILFDLGVSSVHLDDPARGFSFLRDGPLDMRYDDRLRRTAAVLVNRLSEKALADIFVRYGEERFSLRIAKGIVSQRRKHPFRTTRELAQFIEQTVPARHGGIHPATRVFQALRIAVNDEQSALAEALPQAIALLKPGGRLVVLAYHSLEDRIVKHTFQQFSRFDPPIIQLLTKHPLIPSDVEIQENPRARSAKLRACEKL